MLNTPAADLSSYPGYFRESIRLSMWLPERSRANLIDMLVHSVCCEVSAHDDVIKWKHFPRYWPFVRGSHRSRWIPRTKASDAELWCFFYLRPNKRLSKQPWGWWFETPSWLLWRQCNDMIYNGDGNGKTCFTRTSAPRCNYYNQSTVRCHAFVMHHGNKNRTVVSNCVMFDLKITTHWQMPKSHSSCGCNWGDLPFQLLPTTTVMETCILGSRQSYRFGSLQKCSLTSVGHLNSGDKTMIFPTPVQHICMEPRPGFATLNNTLISYTHVIFLLWDLNMIGVHNKPNYMIWYDMILILISYDIWCDIISHDTVIYDMMLCNVIAQNHYICSETNLGNENPFIYRFHHISSPQYEASFSLPLQRYHNERDGVSNNEPHDCLLNHLFRRTSEKTHKRASNAEDVSTWWRHHATDLFLKNNIFTNDSIATFAQSKKFLTFVNFHQITFYFTCHIQMLPSKLLYSWWRHQMEAFLALLSICTGNSPVTGEFSAQRPVKRSFDVFFDLLLNKWLSKQS